MLRLLSALIAFTYFTIVLGAWVRINGAGLTCPDWPLCHGKIIPPMEPGIMLEYFHRLAAALVSLTYIGVIYKTFTSRLYRETIGPLVVFAFLILVVQIFFGAQTIWKLLHYKVVATHLGLGTIFFSCLLLATVRVYRLDHPRDVSFSFHPGLFYLSLFTLVAIFAQIIMGGIVSASYAGHACPDFPTCHGQWWAGFDGLVGLQFMHRIGAVIVLLVATILAIFVVRQNGRRGKFWLFFPLLILLFMVLQWTLGIATVVYELPSLVRMAHSAIAQIIFALTIVVTYELKSR